MSNTPTNNHRWIAGSEVVGSVSLAQFQLNFILLSHAGWAGLVFLAIWVASYWPQWNLYNIWIFATIAALFGLMAWFAPQFANNISSQKLTFRTAAKDQDWFYYARLRMAILLGIFCFNGSLLIWGTGVLASSFVPFYIMVFLLALNYCRFPRPATGLTVAFVAMFLFFWMLSEVTLIHSILPVPIDDKTQAAINNSYGKKSFDAGFIIASMLVPLISMYLAARRTGGDNLPAPSETVTPPKVPDQ